MGSYVFIPLQNKAYTPDFFQGLPPKALVTTFLRSSPFLTRPAGTLLAVRATSALQQQRINPDILLPTAGF